MANFSLLNKQYSLWNSFIIKCRKLTLETVFWALWTYTKYPICWALYHLRDYKIDIYILYLSCALWKDLKHTQFLGMISYQDPYGQHKSSHRWEHLVVSCSPGMYHSPLNTCGRDWLERSNNVVGLREERIQSDQALVCVPWQPDDHVQQPTKCRTIYWYFRAMTQDWSTTNQPDGHNTANNGGPLHPALSKRMEHDDEEEEEKEDTVVFTSPVWFLHWAFLQIKCQ